MRMQNSKYTTVRALQLIGYEMIASGDSHFSVNLKTPVTLLQQGTLHVIKEILQLCNVLLRSFLYLHLRITFHQFIFLPGSVLSPMMYCLKTARWATTQLLVFLFVRSLF